MIIAPYEASSANKAYLYIRNKILDGSFPEGVRITEQEISNELGISRTPIREAIKKLGSEGLLLIKPNSGAFVRSWSREEISNVFDARILIESELAGLAAKNMKSDVLCKLRKIHDEIEVHGLVDTPENLMRISPLNRDFHQLITVAAGNERLNLIRQQTLQIQIIMRTRRKFTAHQLERSFFQHREMLDAFKCGDSEWAKWVMGSHLKSAKHALLEA